MLFNAFKCLEKKNKLARQPKPHLGAQNLHKTQVVRDSDISAVEKSLPETFTFWQKYAHLKFTKALRKFHYHIYFLTCLILLRMAMVGIHLKTP